VRRIKIIFAIIAYSVTSFIYTPFVKKKYNVDIERDKECEWERENKNRNRKFVLKIINKL